MSNPRPKAALFLNPAAASGRARAGRAAEILARHFDLATPATSSAEGMEKAVASAVRDGAVVAVAAGGDGTVNSVVNGLAGTNAVLGIIPVGTANDFSQELGIPLQPEAAAERIIAGSVRRCDAVAVNGRRFCTVGGLGLVTECALSANRLKTGGSLLQPVARLMGPAIYPAVSVPRILLGGRCAWPLRLEWTGPDGGAPAQEGLVHGVFFANQRGIGGDLVLPTEGRNDDGAIELCVMEAGGRGRLLHTVLSLRMAWPIGRHVIAVHRAVRATATSEQELGFLGDGELLCRGRHFELEVIPGGLAVVV